MMRLTALLLAPFLLLAGSASAQESITMKPHEGWMNYCGPDYAAQMEAHGTVLVDRDYASILVKCQCEFDHLPAPGQRVSQGELNNATHACNAEFKAGPEAYLKKYAKRVQASGFFDR